MNAPRTPERRWKVPLVAGAAYFGWVFSAGFILGSIRVTLVVPRIGVRAAELIEAPLMLLATVVAARAVTRRFELAPYLAPRLVTGLVGLGLLTLAEVATVLILQRQTLSSYIASRDPVAGVVYLALLCCFALMPAILAMRPVARRHS